jgi:hypothetical protein
MYPTLNTKAASRIAYNKELLLMGENTLIPNKRTACISFRGERRNER